MKKVLTLAQIRNEQFWPKAALSKMTTETASQHFMLRARCILTTSGHGQLNIIYPVFVNLWARCIPTTNGHGGNRPIQECVFHLIYIEAILI